MTATVFPAINPAVPHRASSYTCVLSWKTGWIQSGPFCAMSVGRTWSGVRLLHCFINRPLFILGVFQILGRRGGGVWESASLHRVWTQLCHFLLLSHSKIKAVCSKPHPKPFLTMSIMEVIRQYPESGVIKLYFFFLNKEDGHWWSVLNCSGYLIISTSCCCARGQEVNSFIQRLAPLILLLSSVWYDFDCLLAIYPATASSLSSPHLIQTFS